MNKRPFSIGLWSIACLALFASVPSAQGVQLYCTPANSFSVNPGNIDVQRDIAVGQPIGDWVESNSTVSYVDCDYDYYPNDPIVSGVKSNNKLAGMTYSGYTVFSTNLAGIGFIIEGKAYFDTTSTWSTWQGVMAGTYERDLSATAHRVGVHPLILNQARIRLIKTGDVTGGNLSGDVGHFYAGLRSRGWFSTEVPITFSGGKVTMLSCRVMQSKITVQLDKHTKSEFSGIGSGTDWHNFNIELDCDINARVHVRIDAVADPSNQAGVLKIDNSPEGTVASGVGIQLYYRPDNSPVIFGQDKFHWQSREGGGDFVQLKARYYQTNERITPGTANGTATFTITYK